MAITDVKRLRGASAMFRYDYRDEQIRETYRIEMNSSSRDFAGLLASAQSTTSGWTNPIPARGAIYPSSTGFYAYPIFVEAYEMAIREEREDHIDVQVIYTSLKAGESAREKPTNPLQWPAEYAITWIEEEYVIEKALNVEALGKQNKRPANTWGPVVNGALQEFDEPLMDTRRTPVLQVTYNVGGLQAAIDLNEQYEFTTNNAEFLGAGPRRARFLVAETSGRLSANGFDYYQMTISIMIRKTTDRVVNNVGWNYLDDNLKLRRILVEDGEADDLVPTSEPKFLKANGDKADAGTAPTITYRYLEEVDYGPLVPASIRGAF